MRISTVLRCYHYNKELATYETRFSRICTMDEGIKDITTTEVRKKTREITSTAKSITENCTTPNAPNLSVHKAQTNTYREPKYRCQ